MPSHASKRAKDVVVRQEYSRPSTSSSSASRSSNASSGPASWEGTYRDPNADGYLVDVKHRKGRNGEVVVINHHTANPAHDEPRSSEH